ncbi:ABC transporter substrate-binding protein [Desulfoplanes formicivorans]|uniref:ABC transporter substrate-binding protein n=1 Tax=Desulfoplanes formicivorans TaxID=1592317 RepID=A0A194AJD0_9BACT|nr:ABC transporter substrate binding protein [Desulfoplanes formicivorans]GAU09345.1 hypothetical protein DPF_2068 [Desulfoplanes formicivorans]
MKQLLLTTLLLLGVLAMPIHGAPRALVPDACTVLVVMSYHESYYGSISLRKAIKQHLGAQCTPVFFYLDSKRHFPKTSQKAREAYDLFRSLRPSGVIAADDNAQRFFVLPYLKNKAELPVIFCGVNADPAIYGYPTKHISGIIERPHIAETIALSRNLDPNISDILFITPNNTTGHAMRDQATKTAQTLGLSSPRFMTIANWKEMTTVMDSLVKKIDAVFLLGIEGVKDANGSVIPLETLIHRFTDRYPVPVLNDTSLGVASGALCTVEQSGEEQGRMASSMLLRALKGTPIAFLPIARNLEGKRYVNVTAIKQLGLHPRPAALRGTTLVRTRTFRNHTH